MSTQTALEEVKKKVLPHLTTSLRSMVLVRYTQGGVQIYPWDGTDEGWNTCIQKIYADHSTTPPEEIAWIARVHDGIAVNDRTYALEEFIHVAIISGVLTTPLQDPDSAYHTFSYAGGEFTEHDELRIEAYPEPGALRECALLLLQSK